MSNYIYNADEKAKGKGNQSGKGSSPRNCNTNSFLDNYQDIAWDNKCDKADACEKDKGCAKPGCKHRK